MIKLNNNIIKSIQDFSSSYKKKGSLSSSLKKSPYKESKYLNKEIKRILESNELNNEKTLSLQDLYLLYHAVNRDKPKLADLISELVNDIFKEDSSKSLLDNQKLFYDESCFDKCMQDPEQYFSRVFDVLKNIDRAKSKFFTSDEKRYDVEIKQVKELLKSKDEVIGKTMIGKPLSNKQINIILS
ncbi:hypothetical protein [Wolbachia endosymbiont of Pentidionis agamae]|uniref:hypothetical protein n=1 Tax=Wolbachia endosymbiont of Pentidionis agamae TaxID=3110435 RepID=UPI002FD3D72A